MADDIKIKKGDFIELDFTAKIVANDVVFDTTQEQVAKLSGIFSKDITYKPIVISVGEGHLLKGLDEFIEDKNVGKYVVEIPSEKAFGKKNAKLLKLISIREFHKNEIQPMPGLEVELDGNKGIVRTVNGGRVIVDFNHPLSSKDIIYDITINKIITDDKIKVEGLMNVYKMPFKNIEVIDGKAIITVGVDVPKEISDLIGGEIKKLVHLKEVEFK